MEILAKGTNVQPWKSQIFRNRLETVGGRWRRDSGSSVAPENKLNQCGGGGVGVGGGSGETLALLSPSETGLEKTVDSDSLTSGQGRATGSPRRLYSHHEAVSLAPGGSGLGPWLSPGLSWES